MLADSLLDRTGAVAHAVPTEGSAEQAAEAYGNQMRERVPTGPDGIPALDYALLGLGEDGHTASLFPDAPALEARGHVCVAVHDAPKPPPDRVSLTLDVLRAARGAAILAVGEGKARPAAAALAGPSPHVPASLLADGPLELILDRAAARAIPARSPGMTPGQRQRRRPGLLRGDRRPRLQADLPGAAVDDPAVASSTCPIIGVAKRAGASTSCKKRAARQPRRSTRRRRRGAFAKLTVAAAATSTATTPTRRRSTSCAHAADGAAAPGPLPRDPAEPVRDRGQASSRRSGCADGRQGRDREAVRPRPRSRPRRSTRTLDEVFPERSIFRIDHYLGKEAVENLLYFRFANTFLEPIWNRKLRRARPDHDGRELRRRRTAARSTTRPGRSAT